MSSRLSIHGVATKVTISKMARYPSANTALRDDEEYEENTKKKGDKGGGAKDKGDKGKGDVGKDKAKEATGKGNKEKVAKPENDKSDEGLPPLVDEEAELVEKEG
eukprot:1161628-Pelagomonas_calceolata.AAC.26